ncbi:glycoside hydrolase domain-containing protein [Streptomyces hydrogenans]|uniref:glycoside hydrolase domain-containing protein n=1 Tax=Streptomyces hydrogenans TaxID=1873719 RepID=UPI0036C8A062
MHAPPPVRTTRSPRAARAVAAALTALALAGVTAPAASALPTAPGATAAAGDTRPVEYRGLRLDVPADWRVVDLEKSPGTCVRFDTATLYLGHPGARQSCPADAVGERTDALVVEPLAGATVPDPAAVLRVPAGRPLPTRVGDDVDREVVLSVEGAGLLVTAVHGAATDTVSRVIGSGRVGPAAVPGTLPAPRAEAQGTAGTARALAAEPTTGYTGKAFDACTAPSASLMRTWKADSPYGGVGIYIGGPTRVCAQPNLTAGWVSDRTAEGWHMIPIYAGRQAAGITPADAAAQGRASADDAVARAKALGFAPRTVLYTDMEDYPSTTYRTRVLDYLSSYSARVHELGFRSGVYANIGNSGDMAALHSNSRYTEPDVLWTANWNGAADVSNSSMGLPGSTYWQGRRRAHQYKGNSTETYGGATLNIDRNHFDVAPATAPEPEPEAWREDAASRVNADFNADGRDDVAALYGYGDGSVALFTFLARADGGFDAPLKSWTRPPGNWTFKSVKLTAGDYDGNGRTDLAAMYDYADGSVALFTFKSRADGGFSDPVKSWTTAPGNWWPENVQLASGDFDGNGRDDVAAFYGYSDGRAALYTFSSDASGGFGTPLRSWNVPENYWWGENVKLASGDFDGNGRDDVAAFYGYSDGRAALYTFKSRTDGGFADPVRSWNVPENYWWGENVKLTAADYDGNGRADVAAMYGYEDGSVALFTFATRTDGTFENPVKSWTTEPGNWWIENVQIASGDFDGNGRGDVAAFYGYSDGRAAFYTFTSDAAGTFGTPLRSWNVPADYWWGDHVKLG